MIFKPFLLVLLLTQFYFTIEAAAIKHIRVVWHQNPASTAHIVWTTDKIKCKSKIYFDTESRNGKIEKYSYQEKAKTRPYFGTLDFRHSSTITNLRPNTKYYFMVKAGDLISKEYYFITAPSNNESFKLLFGGDSRSNRLRRKKIHKFVGKLFEANPSIYAFVHGGDYISQGLSWKLWKEWLTDWQLTRSSDNRILPIIPSRGNHEQFSPLFNDVFASPGGRGIFTNFYKTKFPNLSIINLNSNISYAGPQKKWLASALNESAQDSTFIVANYHRPAWPAVKKPGGALKHWVPLFDDYQIDLAFESDGHALKRTVPIYKNKLDYNKGVTYVGEGGMGVKLRFPQRRNEWYLQSPGYATSKFHIMMLDVSSNEMLLTVNLPSGIIFDQIKFNKRNRKKLIK